MNPYPKGSSPCTRPKFSPVSRLPPAVDASRNPESKADRHLAKRLRRAPEFRASSPLLRDVQRRLRPSMTATAYEWLAPSPRHAGSAAPVHPKAFGQSAGDDPNARDGTRAETSQDRSRANQT